MHEPKITTHVDCGNSPKMQYIKDFNIAFASQDIAALLDAVEDNIIWEMVGDRRIEGKESFHEALKEMAAGEISELVIHNVIAHGNTGASNGEMIFADGTKIAYCDIYKFSSHSKNAKISQITSYAADLK